MQRLASILFFLLITSGNCCHGFSDRLLPLNYDWLTEKSFNDSLEIQYVDLHINPLIFSEVSKYIKEQQDSSLLFKNGFGYVTIGGIKLDHIGQPVLADSLANHLKDILVEFNIGLSSFYPTKHIGKPLYYSYVDNRLILIFEQNVKWIHHNTFSSSSIRKVKELIKTTLKQAFNPDFEFKGMTGEPFFLTKERREQMNQEQILEMGSWSLSRLKTVVQYFDGSISYHYRYLGKVR